MGPRLQERGVLEILAEPKITAESLQWGRAYKSAELKEYSENEISSFHGFNGAALTRARSSVRVHGRGQAAGLASMGPRLQERGVSFSVAFLPEFAEELQWGRAYKSAEFPLRRSQGFSGFSASMGPRLQERGVDGISWHGTRISGVLQWGRAYKSAELYSACCCNVRRMRCFNGAALTRARSSKLYPCGSFLVRGFNGAALTRARS